MDCKGFLCCVFFFYTTDRCIVSVLTHGEKLKRIRAEANCHEDELSSYESKFEPLDDVMNLSPCLL